MKSFKLLNVFAIVAIMLLFSCGRDFLIIEGDGPIVSDYLYLDDFEGIYLNESAEVIIQQGAVQEVEVVGHENIVERLKTDVSNKKWKIDLGRGVFRDYELRVYITVPNLREVHISGSGDVEVKDFDGQDEIELSISGSGEIEMNEFNDAEYMEVSISGSGDIYIDEYFDNLRNLDIRISGSGVFDGYKAETDNCDIRISGSGDCYVTVFDYLDVDISGSGNVFYKGNPHIDTSISGSGDLINAN